MKQLKQIAIVAILLITVACANSSQNDGYAEAYEYDTNYQYQDDNSFDYYGGWQ